MLIWWSLPLHSPSTKVLKKRDGKSKGKHLLLCSLVIVSGSKVCLCIIFLQQKKKIHAFGLVIQLCLSYGTYDMIFESWMNLLWIVAFHRLHLKLTFSVRSAVIVQHFQLVWKFASCNCIVVVYCMAINVTVETFPWKEPLLIFQSLLSQNSITQYCYKMLQIYYPYTECSQ